jgi:hypothetical protein
VKTLDTLPPSLIRFESQLEDAIRERRRQRPRRLAFRASAVCAAVAIGLGVVTLWPGSETPSASAVERAAAVFTAAEGEIVHVVQTDGLARPDGEQETMGSETWTLTSAPYDERHIEYRDGGVRFESSMVNGRPEYYDPQTNTISTLPDGVAVPEGFHAGRFSKVRDRMVDSIRELLESGDAHEAGRETVDGREAIRIVSDVDSRTLLVDAQSYEPIEWTGVADDGTAITTRIPTFETLPATPENLAVLSVRGQHPDAQVKPEVSIVVEPGGNIQVYVGEPDPSEPEPGSAK